MKFAKLNVLVIGLKASGISASNLLRKEGANVITYDDLNAKIPEEEWDKLIEKLDFVVISPAITNSHSLVCKLKLAEIPILSELELGISFLNTYNIIVTGTNGKTTTLGMIEKVLLNMGLATRTMGNIGYPVSQVILDGTKITHSIIEASSFQLEYVKKSRANIACLLNLAPDHMDRYNTFKDYVSAKENVFLNQTSDDFAIMNYDSKTIREIASKLSAKVKFVSIREPIGDFYIKDNYYYYMDKPLINVKDCKIKGEHNRFNFMVALNVANILGGKKENFLALIKEYNLPPHRIEYVGTLNGINYYNDSKGTNISACITAVNSIEESMALIMGGSDKGEEFCEFFEEIEGKVDFVAITGGNAEKIYSSARKVGFSKIKIFDTLKDALEELKDRKDIKNILFSPASASFDRYKNYQERGEIFKEMVYASKI